MLPDCSYDKRKGFFYSLKWEFVHINQDPALESSNMLLKTTWKNTLYTPECVLMCLLSLYVSLLA